MHISLQQFVDISHFPVDHFQLSVSHAELGRLQLSQMFQFLHLFTPPLLLLLELPIHSQQLCYLALFLLNHFLIATVELAYHCLQHLHAVHPTVLQQRSQLRLVQLQILQMLHESAMRRLQRLHQSYNVLRSIQREVLDVNVEGRHHFQLRLHRRCQLL